MYISIIKVAIANILTKVTKMGDYKVQTEGGGLTKEGMMIKQAHDDITLSRNLWVFINSQ